MDVLKSCKQHSVLIVLTGLLYIFPCFIQIAGAAQGPLCLNCKNIPFPRDCDRTVQCSATQKCGGKSYVTDSANVLYDIGCSSACGLKRSNSKRDTTVCSECCDGDYCNRNICGYTSPPQLLNRTYCLKCDDVVHPSQCERTVLCKPDEICYTEYVKRNNEARYRMGCIQPSSCSSTGNQQNLPSLVGRKRFLINGQVRIDTYCNRCCRDKTGSSGNCNRKICNDKEPIPSYVEELILINPPLRTDRCFDLTGTSCKLLVLQDPLTCNDPGIAHFACRETCGTCVATISTGTVIPATDCFYDSHKYQGAYETTVTGAKCIDWSTVFLQESMSSMFPDNSLRDAKNTCRDPDGRGHPWCFTSTNNDWGYCPVPFCEQCYFAGQSQLYSGYKKTDMNGNECDFWKDLSFVLPDNNFIDGSRVAAENYCRNPFPKASQAANSSIDQPLCFTNGGFKSCGVKQCPGACRDDPSTNCSLVQTYVCQNEFNSLTLCPKTCGRCNFGLLPGEVKQPPVDFCEDNPAANCLALQSLICPDPDGARTLCPRTCKQCGPTNTQVTNTPTTDTPSVSSTQLSAPHWLEWGSYICQIKSNVCLMSRFRICSSGTNSDCGTQSNSIQLCTKKECPDEINYLNMLGNSTSSTTTATTTATITATLTPQTTVDSCRDSGAYDCSLVKDAVCDDNDLKHDCNKTCKLCGCRDVLQCTSPSQQSSFCSDADLAVKYCKKTCNKCALPDVPITYNTCNDPVADGSICNKLQSEIGLCQDPDLVQLCPNYCSGRCGPIATCKTCSSGRRSLKNSHTVIRKYLKTRN